MTEFVVASPASEKLGICKSLSACSVKMFSPTQIWSHLSCKNYSTNDIGVPVLWATIKKRGELK